MEKLADLEELQSCGLFTPNTARRFVYVKISQTPKSSSKRVLFKTTKVEKIDAASNPENLKNPISEVDALPKTSDDWWSTSVTHDNWCPFDMFSNDDGLKASVHRIPSDSRSQNPEQYESFENDSPNSSYPAKKQKTQHKDDEPRPALAELKILDLYDMKDFLPPPIKVKMAPSVRLDLHRYSRSNSKCNRTPTKHIDGNLATNNDKPKLGASPSTFIASSQSIHGSEIRTLNALRLPVRDQGSHNPFL
ncbi:hypothetical protein HK098_005498 [Nowakowskiella sp. JEL0407]|nr:hypothetical protein HK098_005498 [Nowakowskiella sp. JEL0407]